MNQPLFIHSCPTFKSRLHAEAGPLALHTSSMSQALRWISDPTVSISGIYLNPNDPSYSALRFLELVSQIRPVTPVFLIDSEDEIHTDSQKHLLESANIRGFFKGTEPFSRYLEKLSLTAPALLDGKKRAASPKTVKGYIAVPLIDFAHSKHYFFDVFVEGDQKDMVLFATAGSPIEPEYLSHVADKSQWLYVSEANISEIRDGIQRVGNFHLANEDFPTSWKTAEALFQAKSILKELHTSGPNDKLVDQTHTILADLFHLISTLGNGTKLQKLIDQAKASDRNIACAALSILMCKSLKFEKTAIVEILGFASFFQDVALYNSPFGDLSESRPEDLHPEAFKYWQQHPLLSADLVATHTSVPDVTLQVMRQHHEKKDRSGFPNRIGGMQLHPMAEALSLINAYLDHAEDFARYEHEVYSHYSDRMVMAFKNLIKISEAKAHELKQAA